MLKSNTVCRREKSKAMQCWRCGGYEIFISDPDFFSIPDSRSRHQEQQGRKKIVVQRFLEPIYTEWKYFLPLKLLLSWVPVSSQKYVWRRGIRDPEKTYPGARIRKVKKHRIRNTANISTTELPGTTSITVLWIRIRNFLSRSEKEKSPRCSNRLWLQMYLPYI